MSYFHSEVRTRVKCTHHPMHTCCVDDSVDFPYRLTSLAGKKGRWQITTDMMPRVPHAEWVYKIERK